MSTGDPPWPLTRKRSITEISPDIQDLGPALTPSQTYSDAGLDAALANLTHSQTEAIDALLPPLAAPPPPNMADTSLNRPSSPKRARLSITLPLEAPIEADDMSSERSTPTGPAHMPWTPSHLEEVFDRALPPVALPTHTPGDLPPSPITEELRTTALVAVDKLNPEFCGFACFFLSSDIDFLLDTELQVSSDALAKSISIVSLVVDLGLGSHHGPDGVVLRPSDWLRLAQHLLAAILRGALRSEALNAQLRFELLHDD